MHVLGHSQHGLRETIKYGKKILLILFTGTLIRMHWEHRNTCDLCHYPFNNMKYLCVISYKTFSQFPCCVIKGCISEQRRGYITL